MTDWTTEQLVAMLAELSLQLSQVQRRCKARLVDYAWASRLLRAAWASNPEGPAGLLLCGGYRAYGAPARTTVALVAWWNGRWAVRVSRERWGPNPVWTSRYSSMLDLREAMALVACDGG